jgi:hypothetical protein
MDLGAGNGYPRAGLFIAINDHLIGQRKYMEYNIKKNIRMMKRIRG